MLSKTKDLKVQYLMVLGSSAIVLIVGFALNILMTHAMSTEDYGYYKAFVNSITTITSIASLGLSLTVSRSTATLTNLKEKRKLTGAALILNMLIALLVFVSTIIINSFLKLFDVHIPTYLLFASMMFFVLLVNRLLLFKYQGDNDMVRYSLLTFVPQCVLIVPFIIFFINEKSVGRSFAIGSYVLSYILIISVLLITEQPIFNGAVKEAKNLFVSNLGYGFQLHLGSLASVASAQVLNLMVASISNLNEYAYFALGISLASPIMQVPSVMGTISFKNNVKAKKIKNKQLLLTIFITVTAILVYSCILKFFIHFLIGKEYTRAIFYAQIMLYYYAFMGIGDFFNRFITAKGCGKMVRNVAFIVGAVLVSLSCVLVPLYGIKGVILSELTSGLVYMLLMILKYIKVLNLKLNTSQ